jgi:2-hydroxychromene-2-carboxylate isomerase
VGASLKLTGMVPLTQQPLRGDYALHDWHRMARLYDLPFAMPARFPVISVAPSRAFYAVEATAPAVAPQFALDLFRAVFGKGIDITDPGRIGEIGAALGLDAAELAAATQDPRWKEALRERTDEAIAKGIFGAPYVRIGDEGFWGSDRLWMAERWLETGGW